MKNIKLIFIIVMVAAYNYFSIAEEKEKIGIFEKTGDYANLNLVFIDEMGQKVLLRNLVKKPTIILLVYYKCPGICNPLLGSVGEVIDNLDLKAGKDFNIISISFDEKDDYKIAAEKKKNYLAMLKRSISEGSWKFLTGDRDSIMKFTESVGFYFKREGKDFIHPTGLIILSPDGKITRYLFGISFLPFDLKMALIEASEGKVGSPVNRVLRFCFSYEPKGRKYAFNFLRIFGIGMVLIAVSLFIFLISKSNDK